MAVEIPHFADPFDFVDDGTGVLSVAVVEQDSDVEITDCVRRLFAYDLGSRPEAADFGIDDQTFRQGGPVLDEIRTALAAYEPRADGVLSLSDEALLDFIGEVRLELPAAGAQ